MAMFVNRDTGRIVRPSYRPQSARSAYPVAALEAQAARQSGDRVVITVKPVFGSKAVRQ